MLTLTQRKLFMIQIKFFMILTIFIVVTFVTMGQVKVVDIKKDGSNSSYTLQFGSREIIKGFDQESGNPIIGFESFDTSDSLYEVSIPKQDIFISLPSTDEITWSYSSPQIEKKLGLFSNYLITTEEMSTPSRDKKESIEFKGYLWLGNYYCAHFTVEQYSFSPAGVYEKINSITLSLKTQVAYPTVSNDSPSGVVNSEIINISEAVDLSKYKNIPDQIRNNQEWIDFNADYAKLKLNQNGVYRITYTDLVSSGFSMSNFETNNLAMLNKGITVPINFIGDNDNIFEDGEYVEFVGLENPGDPDFDKISIGEESYKEYKNRYSDTSVYWLTSKINSTHWVEKINTSAISVTDTLEYHNRYIHVESNPWHDYSELNLVVRQHPKWNKNQTWVLGQMYPGNFTYTLSAPDLYTKILDSVVFKLKVQSFASSITNNAHTISVKVNNGSRTYDSIPFNRFEQKVVSVAIPSTEAIKGSNNFVATFHSNGSSVNGLMHDWYSFSYPQLLTLVKDTLQFKVPQTFDSKKVLVKINGAVSGGEYIIYHQVGNRIRKLDYTISGTNLLFKDTLFAGSTYFVFRTEKVKKPQVIENTKITNLSAPRNADVVILTHKKFVIKAKEYGDYLKIQNGLEPLVVDVEDVYNQFSYGVFNPDAIKDFLIAANTNYGTKPKSLLIIGDATYDYYGNKTRYQGAPRTHNWVPSYGEPVSDYWFVIWDSTGALIPQMSVGRLPVNSNAELDQYFNRRKNYDETPFSEWNKRFLLFSSGNPSNASEILQLRAINEGLIQNFINPAPIGGTANHLYKTTNPNSNFGPYTDDEVSRMIKESGLVISYVGHSGTQIWDNGITDPLQLEAEGNNAPLISDFGCSTGKFAEPDIRAFAEQFLSNSGSQAIGYIGNTSLGFTTTSTVFPPLFFEQLKNSPNSTLGEMHTAAKIKMLQQYGRTGSYEIFTYTNTLFSDPTLQLRIPSKPNLSLRPNAIRINASKITDETDSVSVGIIFDNLGRADSGNYVYKLEHFVNEELFETKTFFSAIPLSKDSVSLFLKTKGKTGNHKLIVTADPDNLLSEIVETDNQITFTFFVATNNIRSSQVVNEQSTISDKFVFINPSYQNDGDSLFVKLVNNSNILINDVYSGTADSIFNVMSLLPIDLYKRNNLSYRYKLLDGRELNGVFSPYYGGFSGYLFQDSVSKRSALTSNLEFTNGEFTLGLIPHKLSLVSAGFYAGSYAIISANGVNYAFQNELDGIFIAQFTRNSLSYLGGVRIGYWENPSAFNPAVQNYLASISDTVIVAMAHGGAGFYGANQQTLDAIRNFGSNQIQNLGFRYSWAMIGRKGLAPGTALEGIKAPYDGVVQLDSVIYETVKQGEIEFPAIGPSYSWKDINFDYSIGGKAGLRLDIFGSSEKISYDSLTSIQVNSNAYDLSFIDASKYPYLKLKATLTRESSADSVILRSLSTTTIPFPELVLNNRSISLTKKTLVSIDEGKPASVANDTVRVGEEIVFKYTVSNAGLEPASNVKVRVNKIIEPDTREVLDERSIRTLNPLEKKYYTYYYNTTPDMGRVISFEVVVDADSTVRELYEDNNTFVVPLFVKKDTTQPVINVSIDGRDILPEEIVPSNPLIRVEMADETLVPIQDSSSIAVFLNGKKISSADGLKLVYNASNPKVIAEYQPILPDGDYELKIVGKNAIGTLADTTGQTRTFKVMNEPKVLDVYNYPNPMQENTSFTFKLTQVPDEFVIRIYTIAGRLIKEIPLSPSQLKVDFNSIPWDGRDQDGDEIANGTYLYTIQMVKGDKRELITNKIAVVR